MLHHLTLRDLESFLSDSSATGPLLHSCPICGEPANCATGPCRQCVLTEIEKRWGATAAQRMVEKAESAK